MVELSFQFFKNTQQSPCLILHVPSFKLFKNISQTLRRKERNKERRKEKRKKYPSQGRQFKGFPSPYCQKSVPWADRRREKCSKPVRRKQLLVHVLIRFFSSCCVLAVLTPARNSLGCWICVWRLKKCAQKLTFAPVIQKINCLCVCYIARLAYRINFTAT